MRSFLTRQLPLQNETTIFILVNVLDIFMTYVLLRFGAIEANPLANHFLKHYGFNGMIFFKLVITGGVCIISQFVAIQSIEKAKRLLILGTAIVSLVVAYSTFLLVTKI